MSENITYIPFEWKTGETITAERLNKDSIVVFQDRPDFNTMHELASAGVTKFMIDGSIYHLVTLTGNNLAIAYQDGEILQTIIFREDRVQMKMFEFSSGNTQGSEYYYDSGDFSDTIIEPLNSLPPVVVQGQDRGLVYRGNIVSYNKIVSWMNDSANFGTSRVPILLRDLTGSDEVPIFEIKNLTRMDKTSSGTYRVLFETLYFEANAANTQLMYTESTGK